MDIQIKSNQSILRLDRYHEMCSCAHFMISFLRSFPPELSILKGTLLMLFKLKYSSPSLLVHLAITNV